MKNCSKCDKPFVCDADNAEKKCWCAHLPPLNNIPKQFVDCLCAKCLSTYVKTDSIKPEPNTLVDGIDYYYENGLMVFTEVYHLKKGSCCNNGCRHCPY